MDANGRELILKDEVFEVVGCAMEVLNVLGHGLLEKPYENALVVEFGIKNIRYRQQPHFDVMYKGVSVGEYMRVKIHIRVHSRPFAVQKTGS